MIVPVIPELEQIQPQGVGHHAEAGKAHGRGAEHGVQCQPQRDEHPGGQRNADGVVEKRPEEVFVNVAERRAAQADGCRNIEHAVGHGPVEAGDHHPAAGGGAAQGLVAGGLIHGTVQPEAEPADAVQKIVAQIVRHEAGGEVLAPAHQLVLTDATVHFLPQGGELRLQRCGQVQLVPDGEIAAADHVEHGVAADAVLQVGVGTCAHSSES